MQTQEQWKDIPGYEGLYQVSDLGNVKSLKFGKEKIVKKAKRGDYFIVNLSMLSCKRKAFSVHQLVTMAFLDHKPNGNKLVIDHINSDTEDNRLENLRIITHRENMSKERTSKTELSVGVDKFRNKFRSRIIINKEKIFLGYFSTQEEASKAYQDKLKEIKQLSFNLQVKD